MEYDDLMRYDYDCIWMGQRAFRLEVIYPTRKKVGGKKEGRLSRWTMGSQLNQEGDIGSGDKEAALSILETGEDFIEEV